MVGRCVVVRAARYARAAFENDKNNPAVRITRDSAHPLTKFFAIKEGVKSNMDLGVHRIILLCGKLNKEFSL
jgi:hypothetical protein